MLGGKGLIRAPQNKGMVKKKNKKKQKKKTSAKLCHNWPQLYKNLLKNATYIDFGR